jgi:hypothetical protein
MKYLVLIILLFFCGCYSERKAKSQFAKAAIAYPKLPAEYCAIIYPIKDSIIKDTVLTTDTVLVQGQDITDTIFGDTIRITTIRYLPGKIITNTIHVTDTIIRENTAALKLCEFDKSIALGLLKEKTAEAAKYKRQAKIRGWIMWGLIAFIIAIIGLNIYLRANKIKV